MSRYEEKEGRGTLFVNERKQGDNSPDWSGKVNVGGVLYAISGWDKRTTKGNDMISLSVREWEDRPPRERGRDDRDDRDSRGRSEERGSDRTRHVDQDDRRRDERGRDERGPKHNRRHEDYEEPGF